MITALHNNRDAPPFASLIKSQTLTLVLRYYTALAAPQGH